MVDVVITACPIPEPPPVDIEHTGQLKGVCVDDNVVKVLYAWDADAVSVVYDVIEDGVVRTIAVDGGPQQAYLKTQHFVVAPGQEYELSLSVIFDDGDVYEKVIVVGCPDIAAPPPVEPPPVEPPPVENPKECELWITKTVVVHSEGVGGVLTFRIEFGNEGDANCTGSGTRIMDLLPPGTELLYVELDELNDELEGGYNDVFDLYDPETHSVHANAHTLVPGEESFITITVKVLAPEACGDFVIANQAMITSREYNSSANWHNGWQGLNWVKSDAVSVDVDNDCDDDVVTIPDDEIGRCLCIVNVDADPALERAIDRLEQQVRELETRVAELEQQLQESDASGDDVAAPDDSQEDPGIAVPEQSEDLLRYFLVALLALILGFALGGIYVRRQYQLYPELTEVDRPDSS